MPAPDDEQAGWAPLGWDGPLLRAHSPRQIALMIRSLDSKLVRIELDDREGARALMYTFELAGERQTFRVAANSPTLPSIADLYPEAIPHERALAQQLGLQFHRKGFQADDTTEANTSNL